MSRNDDSDFSPLVVKGGEQGSFPAVAKVALASYFGVTLLSLGSNFFVGEQFGGYPVPLVERDLGVSLLCGGLAAIYVKLISGLAKNGVLESRDSRKIIHTGSAPLFLLLWPLFSDAVGARFFAAVISGINAYKLYVAGSGKSGEEAELANAVSRSGDAREALAGPFLYCLILLSATLLFWRDNMIGVMALMTMAAGDGMADIVGRRWGKAKWPFSEQKSYAGSFAFFVASFIAAIGMCTWYTYTGVLSLSLGYSEQLFRIAFICFACSLIELVPIGDDNWTVPLSAAVLASLMLH